MPPALALVLTALAAAPDSAATVFGQLQDRVGQVRVIESASGVKSVIGSGFLVSDQGHLATNFHVISDLVHHPERYRAELVREGLPAAALELLAIDGVHDLAVLRLKEGVAPHFDLGAPALEQGVRLFSLGNPQDLGLTIVEGTYNGPLRERFYERLNFSGAINAGMSGGPAVTAGGEVVGVNVASGGNGLGFLVPVVHLRSLLDEVRSRPEATRKPREVLRDQLLANQERMAQLLLSPAVVPAEDFGGHKAPGRWASFLRCWGDSDSATRQHPFTSTHLSCVVDEELFVSSQQRTGVVRFSHTLTTSDQLNAVRFSSRQQKLFRVDDEKEEESFDTLAAGEEDVTSYRCRTRFVRHGATLSRVAFCARAYRNLPGLYDAVLHVATLNDAHASLQSRLVLGGFSFENAQAIAQRFVEAIAW